MLLFFVNLNSFTAACPADELLVYLRRVASRASLSVLVGWPHEDLLSLFQFLSDGLTRTYFLVVNVGIGVPVQSVHPSIGQCDRYLLLLLVNLSPPRLSYILRLTVSRALLVSTGY